MNGRLQDILNTLPEKPPRSRLEPYRDLIDELRRRGWTYQDIVGILAEKCQLTVSVSTLHDYVRLRSLGKKTPTMRIGANETRAGGVTPKVALPGSDTAVVDDEEVRRRITALKARKTAAAPPLDRIDFDPTQPLRLIKPGKPPLEK
jgi:IS30 family transposase